jgi:hypothetical protein
LKTDRIKNYEKEGVLMSAKRIRKTSLAVALIGAMMLVVSSCGGGGGGGESAPAVKTSAAGGMGSVAAAVKFSGRINGRAVAVTGAQSVNVTITISGYYLADGSAFPPVSATVNVDPTAGPVDVQVLDVPIGNNHLLVATADWGDGLVETLKVIIPAVTEGETVSTTANQMTTAVANAAIYYAEQNGLTLDKVDYSEIEKIQAAVQALYASGVPYYEMQPGAVIAYAENMSQIAGVILAPDSATVVKGGTYQFTITVADANGNDVPGAVAVLAIDPATIGTIDAAGLFTAADAGTGVLTATYDTFSATAALTVIDACGSNADCDDGNALTLDACANPGTASAACSYTTIACSSDADCNDTNALTLDSCSNGGTASAACTNTAITCNTDADCNVSAPVCVSGGTVSSMCIACSVDGDCNDGNALTLDTCSNADTASASCSHSSYACNTVADCAAPANVCLNGGTLTSACIACSSGTDCDASTPLCSGAGTVASFCYACDTDTDCDDGDSGNMDTCFEGGTAQAVCAHSTNVASGNITADETWNLAGSPYFVAGQIMVDAGVTLTIEPGAQIVFDCPGAGNDFTGMGSGISAIYVEGALNAAGTAAAPISMMCGGGGGQLAVRTAGASMSGDPWGGIHFFGSDAAGTLQYINMDSTIQAIVLDGTTNSIPISNINITNAGDAGGMASYHVFVKTQSGWKEAGVEHYGLHFERRLMDLSPYLPDADGEYKVRITQSNTKTAQIDAVQLMADGKALSPVAITEQAGNPVYLYKVARADNDVLDATGRTFDVVFTPARGAGSLALALTAREESKNALALARPFTFPRTRISHGAAPEAFHTYTLGAHTGRLTVDGEFTAADNLPAPLFATAIRPDTGHPAATTYGYIKNDGANLYAALDFTSDNTYDGDEDYAALHVRAGDQWKTFRVSVRETRYGAVGFTYTDNAGYQHKVYEFQAPLAEIGSPAPGTELAVVYEAYGTSAMLDGIISVGYADAVDMSNISLQVDSGMMSGYAFKLENLGAGPHTVDGLSIADGFNGVYLNYVTGLTMSNVNLSYHENAFTAENVTDGTFENIAMSDVGTGLQVFYGDTVSVSNFSTTQATSGSGLEVANSTAFSCDNGTSCANGMYTYETTGTISTTDLSFNSGRGLLADMGSSLTINNSRFASNYSYGVYSDASVTLNNCNIEDNSQYGAGGTGITLNSVYLSGNNGASPGEVDTSTSLPTSDSGTPQYYDINGISTPAATPDLTAPVNDDPGTGGPCA